MPEPAVGLRGARREAARPALQEQQPWQVLADLVGATTSRANTSMWSPPGEA